MLGTDTSCCRRYQQMQGLTYVTQILNETLRLWPTAAAFTRYPYEDALVGGYLLPKGSSVTALTIMLHRDKSIWGDDAEEFNPDHFRPETRAQLAGQRVQTVRFGSAGLHRASVRHAGGGAGSRHALATLRVRGSPELSSSRSKRA